MSTIIFKAFLFYNDFDLQTSITDGLQIPSTHSADGNVAFPSTAWSNIDRELIWYVSTKLIKKTYDMKTLSLDELIALLKGDEIDMLKLNMLNFSEGWIFLFGQHDEETIHENHTLMADIVGVKPEGTLIFQLNDVMPKYKKCKKELEKASISKWQDSNKIVETLNARYVKRDTMGIGYNTAQPPFNHNYRNLPEDFNGNGENVVVSLGKDQYEPLVIDKEQLQTLKNYVLYLADSPTEEVDRILAKQYVVLQDIESDEEVKAFVINRELIITTEKVPDPWNMMKVEQRLQKLKLEAEGK
ncbi:hypothetical protein L1987_15606 [Smallanthus sonchifolius]|uniref:Uncharacterized protein n=1 Tax=Smallanthus sonchifolius TaxID=185202 RepID=A0ACB9J9I2_9ASTR|nr:hypothetical protein L1987_15606 [Smallanthus sonchifolius]